MPVYTLTDYRSEMQTLKHVIIDISKITCFMLTPFGVYIALSWSHQETCIWILCDFENNLFMQHPGKSIVYARQIWHTGRSLPLNGGEGYFLKKHTSSALHDDLPPQGGLGYINSYWVDCCAISLVMVPAYAIIIFMWSFVDHFYPWQDLSVKCAKYITSLNNKILIQTKLRHTLMVFLPWICSWHLCSTVSSMSIIRWPSCPRSKYYYWWNSLWILLGMLGEYLFDYCNLETKQAMQHP